MKNAVDTSIFSKQSVQITPEMERRMRLMANLIIDRIYEDKKNNRLIFQASSNRVANPDNKRVIQRGNTT